MKHKILLALTAIIMLAACKKDKHDDVTIMGKWTVDNTVEKEYQNGTLTSTETLPGGGATIDFQDNGHAVTKDPTGAIESVLFTVKPNNKIEIDGEEYEIRNLTSSTVQLYLKDVITPTYYYEVYISLKR